MNEKDIMKMAKPVTEEHINKFFTEWGYKTLLNYTKQLIKYYYQKQEKDFPLKIGVVLGVSFFNETDRDRIIKNKDELKGRIIGYMQIMSLKKIEVDIGSTGKIIFGLEEQ